MIRQDTYVVVADEASDWHGRAGYLRSCPPGPAPGDACAVEIPNQIGGGYRLVEFAAWQLVTAARQERLLASPPDPAPLDTEDHAAVAMELVQQAQRLLTHAYARLVYLDGYGAAAAAVDEARAEVVRAGRAIHHARPTE